MTDIATLQTAQAVVKSTTDALKAESATFRAARDQMQKSLRNIQLLQQRQNDALDAYATLSEAYAAEQGATLEAIAAAQAAPPVMSPPVEVVP